MMRHLCEGCSLLEELPWSVSWCRNITCSSNVSLRLKNSKQQQHKVQLQYNCQAHLSLSCKYWRRKSYVMSGPFWYHCLHLWKEMLKFLDKGKCFTYFKRQIGSCSIIPKKRAYFTALKTIFLLWGCLHWNISSPFVIPSFRAFFLL